MSNGSITEIEKELVKSLLNITRDEVYILSIVAGAKKRDMIEDVLSYIENSDSALSPNDILSFMYTKQR